MARRERRGRIGEMHELGHCGRVRTWGIRKSVQWRWYSDGGSSCTTCLYWIGAEKAEQRMTSASRFSVPRATLSAPGFRHPFPCLQIRNIASSCSILPGACHHGLSSGHLSGSNIARLPLCRPRHLLYVCDCEEAKYYYLPGL